LIIYVSGVISSHETRKAYALNSRNYYCPQCGVRHPDLLFPFEEKDRGKIQEIANNQIKLLLERSVGKKINFKKKKSVNISHNKNQDSLIDDSVSIKKKRKALVKIVFNVILSLILTFSVNRFFNYFF
jgi:hypothetical protein